MTELAAKSFQRNTVSTKRPVQIPISNFFGKLAFYGMLSTILLSAIPNGTVVAWHKALLVVAICFFAVLRVAGSSIYGSFRFSEPLLLLPLIGILCLAVFQIVTWPGGTSALSVDPYETKVFITVFAALLLVAESLFFYTSTFDRLKILIGLVIIVGTCSAILGVVNHAFLDARSGLLSGDVAPGEGYAQFINRNHFALLMEMTLGLMLGLLIKGHLSKGARFIGWIFAGVIIYSILTANSRGGLMGFAALCLFAVFVHILTRRESNERESVRSYSATGTCTIVGKISVAIGLSVLVFSVIVLAIVFVGGDRVVTRIEKVDREVAMVPLGSMNRASIWNSTIELVKERPIFGAGFGAYAVAIPKFDTSNGEFSLHQAHNEYLEILANGGIVGFSLFACFGVLTVLKISKNLRSLDPLRRASCFGATIGMFGVMMHNFVDYGLHVLVNALIFTVLVVIATVDLPYVKEIE